MLHLLQWMRFLGITMLKTLFYGLLFLPSLYLTINLVEKNSRLEAENAQLKQENEVALHCNPKKKTKAILSYVNGRLFCEVHKNV